MIKAQFLFIIHIWKVKHLRIHHLIKIYLVFSIDADAKSGLMNGVQYMMANVAMVDMLMKKLFTDTDPHSKGSIELLAKF